MAYVSNLQNPEEEQLQNPSTPSPIVQNTGGVNAGAKGGTAGGPAQTSQNAAPSTPSSSGQFTNVQAYLNANPTSAQTLGSNIGGQIDTATQTASDTIANNEKNFENQVTAGTDTYNPDLVNSAVTNPTSFVANDANMQKLAAMRAGTYSGPTDWSASGNAQNALDAQSRADQVAQLGGTAAGRETLIQQQPGQATSAGNLNLDQFLVQNTPGALDTITGAASKEGSTVGPGYGTAEGAAGNAVTAGQTTSAATGPQTQSALDKGLADYRAQIQAAVDAANAKANAAETAAQNAVSGGGSTAPGAPHRISLGPNNPREQTGTATNSAGQPVNVNPDGSVTPVQQLTNGPGSVRSTPGNTPIRPNVKSIPTGGVLGRERIGNPSVNAAAPNTSTTTQTVGKALTPTLDAGTLAQLGLTQAQWTNLVNLQNQAIKYGGGIDASNYLHTTASSLGASQVVDPTMAGNYNALNQIAGETDSGTLSASGTAGSQNFDMAGAVAALQAQVSAGQAQEAQKATAAAAQNASEAQVNAVNQNTQTMGLVGGAVAGAEIGSSFGPIGTVVGGVIGAVVGIFSCFANGTKIRMKDGSFKNIERIEIGDLLFGGGLVFQKGIGLCNALYHYKGVDVAGGHTVLEDNKWIHVRDSKLAKKLPLMADFVKVNFLSVTSSVLHLEQFIATDYQETLDLDLVMRHEQERVDWLNQNTVSQKQVG